MPITAAILEVITTLLTLYFWAALRTNVTPSTAGLIMSSWFLGFVPTGDAVCTTKSTPFTAASI